MRAKSFGQEFYEYLLIGLTLLFVVWALFVSPAYGGELRSSSSGGGGVTVGGSITGAVANCVLYADAAGTALDCEAAFTYDETTNTLTADVIVGATSMTTQNLTLNAAADQADTGAIRLPNNSCI